MTLDVTPEPSAEQLIRALGKKFSTEYTNIRSAVPPPSSTLIAALTAQVWSCGTEMYLQVLTEYFPG